VGLGGYNLAQPARSRIHRRKATENGGRRRGALLDANRQTGVERLNARKLPNVLLLGKRSGGGTPAGGGPGRGRERVVLLLQVRMGADSPGDLARWSAFPSTPVEGNCQGLQSSGNALGIAATGTPSLAFVEGVSALEGPDLIAISSLSHRVRHSAGSVRTSSAGGTAIGKRRRRRNYSGSLPPAKWLEWRRLHNGRSALEGHVRPLPLLPGGGRSSGG